MRARQEQSGRDLMIQLDKRGVELLQELPGPGGEFRVTPQPDSAIEIGYIGPAPGDAAA